MEIDSYCVALGQLALHNAQLSHLQKDTTSSGGFEE